MSKFKIFDHLNNLTENKVNWDEGNDEQTKGYTPYMINRWISMCEFYIPLVNEINQYNLPNDIHYNYYLNALPQRKQYFKYLKKDTKSANLSNSDKENLYNYFEIGPRQLDDYLDILTDKQVSEVLELYNDGLQ